MLLRIPRPIPKQDWLQKTNQSDIAFSMPAPLHDGERERVGATQPEGWEAAIGRLAAMRELADDWDGLGAAAPSHDLLASAIGLAHLLQERGLPAPRAVAPSTAGTVLLDWQEPDGTYGEIEVVRPFYAEVMLVEPGKPAQHWELPDLA
jgi:hypothetical protein